MRDVWHTRKHWCPQTPELNYNLILELQGICPPTTKIYDLHEFHHKVLLTVTNLRYRELIISHIEFYQMGIKSCILYILLKTGFTFNFQLSKITFAGYRWVFNKPS